MSQVAFSGTVATTKSVADFGLVDRILARTEKLEEQAKEVVEAIAKRYYHQRKLNGGDDARNDDELALEDWCKAEETFCALLEDRIQRELESSSQRIE